jgi:hypothetical protein
MRHRQVIGLLAFLAVAAVSVGAGGAAASAQPAADDTAIRSGETKQANRGKGKRPSCRRFCQQLGGFGAECDEPNQEDCNDVYVPGQTLDGTRDQVVSIRATCKLAVDCVGGIILTSFKGEFEYGRADFAVPAGQSGKVKIGISNKGLAFLKDRGKDRTAFATTVLDRDPDTVSISLEGITVLPPG